MMRISGPGRTDAGPNGFVLVDALIAIAVVTAAVVALLVGLSVLSRQSVRHLERVESAIDYKSQLVRELISSET